jgi:hypothetical protein
VTLNIISGDFVSLLVGIQGRFGYNTLMLDQRKEILGRN